jgi:hypothetical protein
VYAQGAQLNRCLMLSYIPGWDCHGLPIEHKSLKALGVSPRDVFSQLQRDLLDPLLNAVRNRNLTYS